MTSSHNLSDYDPDPAQSGYAQRLQGDINDADRRIRMYNSQLSEAKKRLIHLHSMQDSLGRFHAQFDEDQNNRRKALSDLRAIGMDSKTVRGYVEAMTAHVNGNLATSVTDNFSASQRKISHAIEEARMQVDHLTRMISLAQSEKAQLQEKMSRQEDQ